VHRLDVKAAKTQHFPFIYGNVGNSLRISCGVRGIDYKAVSVYLSGFQGLHLSCLLNLKRRNTYMETYRGGTFGAKFGLENR